jgi:hypothetical protein
MEWAGIVVIYGILVQIESAGPFVDVFLPVKSNFAG